MEADSLSHIISHPSHIPRYRVLVSNTPVSSIQNADYCPLTKGHKKERLWQPGSSVTAPILPIIEQVDDPYLDGVCHSPQPNKTVTAFIQAQVPQVGLWYEIRSAVGRPCQETVPAPLIKPGDISIELSIAGTSLKMLFGLACET